MKKLEEFLAREQWLCWLLRIGMLCIWLYAVGFFGLVAGSWGKEPGVDTSGETFTRQQDTLRPLVHELEENALAKGTAYGPKEYFTDLLLIERKAKEIGFTQPSTLVWVLSGQSMHNIFAGRFSPEEAEKCKAEYFRLTPFKDVYEAEKVSDSAFAWSWPGIWFAYWLGLLFMIPTYLLRMVEERGIAETILADKIKMLLAVAFWPYYIFRYPGNVLREIVVEAEMRRLKGQLWQAFGRNERAQIREIANSSGYNTWRKEFRSRNADRIRYRLATAILVTILVLVLAPLTAQARTLRSSASPPSVMAVARAGPIIIAMSNGLVLFLDGPPGLIEEGLPDSPTLPDFTSPEWHLPINRWMLQGRIDHVPLSCCLAAC